MKSLTKTKIKKLIPPGSTLCKTELIELIKHYANQYNDGFRNMKHVAVGLFIASGLTHKSATTAFYKIQQLKNYHPLKNQCIVCGEDWLDEECVNCGNLLPF